MHKTESQPLVLNYLSGTSIYCNTNWVNAVTEAHANTGWPPSPGHKRVKRLLEQLKHQLSIKEGSELEKP